MKCVWIPIREPDQLSRPARGAWIEMSGCKLPLRAGTESRPARGAWIEITHRQSPKLLSRKSRPARGAWIEILEPVFRYAIKSVAPRTGRVD